MPDKVQVLTAIEVVGMARARALRAAEDARRRFAELAPEARDAGATVQEIADAYGVTRPGVYEVMRAAKSEVNRENEEER